MDSLSHILFLNGNGASNSWLAIDKLDELIVTKEKGAFQLIQDFLKKHKSHYVFGYFGYDLKNDLEDLISEHHSNVEMPVAHLFVPKHLGSFSMEGNLNLISGEKDILLSQFESFSNPEASPKIERDQIKCSLSEEEYLQKIGHVKKHIKLGDIYEMNFCYEYYASNIELNPKGFYQKLNSKTHAPFSVYGQLNDHFILSASPERFIKKEGNTVTSQPIKGTIKRGQTEEEDQALIHFLENSPKDRSENVMIVDLVRNDLSKIAKPSSVKVEELCKIYTFKNIHQMISTITAEVEDIPSIEVIKALFPMGSMTGAPKIRAMELIEEYEESKRGLYSGCIGYFAPNGDFDFNVVIRTLIYNQREKKLSFSVGGAITDLSLPEVEFEETLLKAKAIIDALTQ